VASVDLAILVHHDQPGPQPSELAELASERGVQAEIWSMRELSLEVDARGTRLLRRGQAVAPPRLLTQGLNRSWALARQLLDAAARSEARVVNPTEGSTLALDKLATACQLAASGLPIVPLRAQPWGARPAAPPPFAPPFVTKPTAGSNGRGIELHQGWAQVEQRLGADRVLGPDGLVGAELVQPLGGAERRERRVVVMGGRPMACVGRRPREGIVASWSNAVVEPVEDPEAMEVARRATEALGLDYAAVDLIDHEGGLGVLEVNCWPRDLGAMGRLCGVDLLGALVELVAG
jgi:glutathione synthase/RimK-type ligase-like ATP-grasp enzyme